MRQLASGIRAEDVKLGDGAIAERGCLATIRWECRLNRGDPVRNGTDTLRIGKREAIAGLERGVIGMRVGGIRKLRISPHLAYRDAGAPGIPPNALLEFEVELLSLSD
jgi:FKBP-type peptidyl-prolyl cis-trans isomerase FkpA